MPAQDVQGNMRILLVEDEANLARPLQFNLEQEGYQVRATGSGREALELQAEQRFDLVILDLMIEEIDGFEVARQIRRKCPRLPILMLTARSTEQDRVQGLEIGADDYMVKPFHLQELLLRVRRMLERAGWYGDEMPPHREISIAGYRVNLESLSAEGPRGSFRLTNLEASLLEKMADNPHRVFSRADLLEKVWGYRGEIETRTVDNFIVRLRRYFEADPEHPEHFISVRGRGYKYIP